MKLFYLLDVCITSSLAQFLHIFGMHFYIRVFESQDIAEVGFAIKNFLHFK